MFHGAYLYTCKLLFNLTFCRHIISCAVFALPYLSGAVCCKPWPWESEGEDKIPQCCKLQICHFLVSDTLVEMSHYTVAMYITEGPEDNRIDSSSFACCSHCSPICIRVSMALGSCLCRRLVSSGAPLWHLRISVEYNNSLLSGFVSSYCVYK